MSNPENIQVPDARQELPTPSEVFDAISQAAVQIQHEMGVTIPIVTLRERACAILYGGHGNAA